MVLTISLSNKIFDLYCPPHHTLNIVIKVGADGRAAMPSLNTQNKNNLKKKKKNTAGAGPGIYKRWWWWCGGGGGGAIANFSVGRRSFT